MGSGKQGLVYNRKQGQQMRLWACVSEWYWSGDPPGKTEILSSTHSVKETRKKFYTSCQARLSGLEFQSRRKKIIPFIPCFMN